MDYIWAWSICPSRCRPFLHPISSLSCQSLSGPGFCLRGHLSVSRPLSKCCSGSHFPSSGASTRTSEDNLVLPWKSCYTLNLPSSALPGEIEKNFWRSRLYFLLHPSWLLHIFFQKYVCRAKGYNGCIPFPPFLETAQRQRSAFCEKGYQGSSGGGVLMTLSSHRH